MNIHSWTYKFTTSDLFFNPMALTPVKINNRDIHTSAYNDSPLFTTQAEALQNIQENRDKLTISETIQSLDMPTNETMKDKPLKKVIIFRVFKYFMYVFVATTIPIMNWQITRFINHSKKTNPESWI